MNAVIYARYSSDNQREESIEGQLRECKEYADQNGITVVRTYIDRALSAKTDSRPQFQQMIHDSATHTFEAVLVWKLDRFSRNRYDSAHYKRILKNNRVHVVSVTESISNTPEGIMLESLLEGMAEYYSAELAEKVSRGHKENALKAKFNGGPVPLGYRIDSEHRYQIDPATAPVVQEAFQRYAAGESIRSIIESLNARGIRNSRGNPFTKNSFQTLLKNRRYLGEYRYKDTVIPDAIPAIIDPDCFDAVQRRCEIHRQAPAHNKADVHYLLTTKLFCGKCGTMMAGESGRSHTGTVHCYYKCGTRKRSGKEVCSLKPVRKEPLEQFVVQTALEKVLNDRVIDLLADKLLEYQSKENTRLPVLQAELKEVKRRIDNLVAAIEQGILTPATKARMEELEQQREALETGILQEQIEKLPITREQILFWFDQFRHGDPADIAFQEKVIDYYTAPYTAGEIEKSSVELGAFAKTKELAPGESEEVTLTVPVSDMASYDAYDANHNGFTGYELDAGDYIFTVRHDAHDVDDDANAAITCSLPAGVQYAEDTATGNAVSHKFTGSDAIDGVSLDGSDSDQNITYLTRADFAGTFPKTNTPTRAMTDNVKALNLYTADDANGWINDADEAITTGAKNGLKIEDNGETTDLGFRLGSDFNDPRWDALLDQLTVDEMENLYINAYGGLAELKSVGKSKSKDADGPAQIGGFTGMGAGTGFPSSSTLAQTWNADLAQEEGRTIGTQALQNGYTGWYAPATNMHRSPFNGRNYEYYSEDSLLSGVICGNTVTGTNQAGVYTYVKHFICNDGESGIYRDSVYTWMTEQTLRETYLRPFQMLVEDYDAVGLMSSYNRIGAVWAGGSEALLTGILRDEWGFDGAVITDYCDHHSYMNGDQALRAGGSLWMAGFTGGAMAFETGSNSYLQALRRATKEALYMYLHVRVTNRDYADSIGDTTALRHAFTTSVFGWRHLVALIDIVAVVLFALAVRGVVIDGKLRKAAKTEKKNS